MNPTTSTLCRIVAIPVITLAACLPVACAREVKAEAVDEPTPILVMTTRAAMTDIADAIETGGVVQARTTAMIAARILAPVRDVRVAPGDRVREGETLIVLSAAHLTAGARVARSAAVAADQGAKAAAADLEGAEARLVLARATRDRIAALAAQRSATNQELDEATAALRTAEAGLAAASARAVQATSSVESARAASDAASAQESFTAITAPFDGVITDKLVEPGNMVAPGAPLLRIEDTRRFRLEVHVNESHIDQIRIGDSVPISVGTAAIVLDGVIDEISRAVDADTRAFLVKIALPDSRGLRSGQFGRARFERPRRSALTVPASAIVRRGQLTSVFVVEGDRARVRLVNLSGLEVTAGLDATEVVIVSPPIGLVDGDRVIVGGR